MRNNKPYWHNLLPTNVKEMQNDFIFLDVETKKFEYSYKNYHQKFYLCCAIFQNRKENLKIEKIYYNRSELWNDVEKQFNFHLKEKQEYIIYTHNAQFDFKLVNGYKELIKRGWKLSSPPYVKGIVFIANYQKNNCILKIWSTTNYVSKTLEEIGESLGFPKLKVDFNKCTDKELEIYCMRDTNIVFHFVNKLVKFLLKYHLSELKATISSLSMNCFLSSFFHPEKGVLETQIGIHCWKQAQILERMSYKGGISDCFKIGESKEYLYKLDINSQYPASMRNERLPVRLVGTENESVYVKESYVSEHLDEYYKYLRKHTDYLLTADCTIYLPEKWAYVIKNFKEYGLNKTVFFSGITRIVLNSPVLDFVEKYGKILKIHRINVYDGRVIFKEFVDFFYDKKVLFQEQGDKIFREFCKIILNGQYGKWGQRFTEWKKINFDSKFWKNNEKIILLMMDKKGLLKYDDPNLEFMKEPFIYLGPVNKVAEFYLIDGRLWYFIQTKENSKEAFVAISSFITSYARIMLVNYLLIAKRENVYYTDTDSLYVNEKGLNYLKEKNLISDIKLGALKIEDEGYGIFYGPKFYDFNSVRKCKGIKRNSMLLEENEKEAVYLTENWQKLKTDLKFQTISEQIITLSIKRMNKTYTKGIVKENGDIRPYSVLEIMKLKIKGGEL